MLSGRRYGQCKEFDRNRSGAALTKYESAPHCANDPSPSVGRAQAWWEFISIQLVRSSLERQSQSEELNTHSRDTSEREVGTAHSAVFPFEFDGAPSSRSEDSR